MEILLRSRLLQIISSVIIALILLLVFKTIKTFPINLFVLIVSCIFYILSGFLSNSRTDVIIRISTLILIILTGGAFYEDASDEDKSVLEWWFIVIPIVMLIFMCIINRKMKIKKELEDKKIQHNNEVDKNIKSAIHEINKKSTEMISLAEEIKKEVYKLSSNHNDIK